MEAFRAEEKEQKKGDALRRKQAREAKLAAKSEAEEHNIDVALTVLIIAPIVMSVLLDFVVAKLLVSARMPLPPTRSTPPTDSQSRRSQPSPRKTLTLATPTLPTLTAHRWRVRAT